MEEEFGDFREVSDQNEQPQEGFTRARLPKKGELIGALIQRLGGNRMEIRTADGKTRNCRVPGRFKRTLWLRPGDFVIIQPWESDDTKGDVIYKYSKAEVAQLKKRSLIETPKAGF